MSEIGKYQVIGQGVIGNKISGRIYEIYVGYREAPFLGSLLGDGEELKHGDVVNYGKIIGDSNLIIIFPNYGGSAKPGAAGIVLAGYEPIDWVQGMVNPGLNLFVNGTYNVPEVGGAELISPFNTDAQDGAGMGRCLGVVSIGTAWVHCYYVANSGFTGYDKIRTRARLHSNNAVLWTYDIAIGTIANATNTSIPTTSNLFWDEELKHLIIIDFRFYAISIPDPLVTPVSFQERNQTARRGAGYAPGNGFGSIFHHTGSGANLYKFDPAGGFTAAIATINFNAAWPAGWTPNVILTTNMMDSYRFFNKPWVYAKNRWHSVMAAKNLSGTPQTNEERDHLQLRIFSADPANSVISNNELFKIDVDSIEVISVDELIQACNSRLSQEYPYVATYELISYVGILGDEYSYFNSPTLRFGFSPFAVLGYTYSESGSTLGKANPGKSYVTYSWAGGANMNITGSGFLYGFQGLITSGVVGFFMCPRPTHAVYYTPAAAGGSDPSCLVDDFMIGSNTNNWGSSSSVYPGIIKVSENIIAFAALEPVLFKVPNPGGASGAVGTDTQLSANVGWEPGDPGYGGERTRGLSVVHNVGYITKIYYVDVSVEIPVLIKRLEISERKSRNYPMGYVYAPIGEDNVAYVSQQLPNPCNVWQLAAIENGPFAGSIISLQDSPSVDGVSGTNLKFRDPMLKFRIVNPGMEVSYTSADFGPPQSIVSGNSNSYYNGKNQYAICSFKTGSSSSSIRVVSLGHPQIRVFSPNDGSAPIFVIGVWSEKITDGTNSATYDNDHFRTDIWVYRMDSISSVTLLKHFSEAHKTITENVLPRGTDFERMVFSNGSLKYVNFQNNTRKLMVL